MPRWLVKHYFCMTLWVCLWKRIAFELADMVKINLTKVVGCHLILGVTEGLDRTKRSGMKELSSELRHPPSLALGLWCSWFLDFGTKIGTYTTAHWVLMPADWGWFIPAAFLLQLVDGKLWDFSASISAGANFYDKFLCVCVCVCVCVVQSVQSLSRVWLYATP